MHATKIMRPRFHWPTIWATTAVCVGVFGLGGALVWRLSHQVPLPETIRSQVHFPVFLPHAYVVIDPSSYKYDRTRNVLSFAGKLPDGQSVTITEQSTPEAFTDIPNYYEQFLRTLFEYQSFDSLQGTVHITHPKAAGQVAVMNAKGVLFFASVKHDESRSTWQQVFSTLQLYQP